MAVGGANEPQPHARAAHDLRVQLLQVENAVAVRRIERKPRPARVDPEVEDHEGVADGALSTPVRRVVQDLAVEGHGRRSARVESHCGARPEVGHQAGELGVGHPGAPRAAAVDGEEEDPPVP